MAKKTVESVMATGHHLLVQVKANQPTLFQHLTETDPAQPPQDRHHTHEIGRHHRIEQRLTRTWSLPLGIGTEDGHARFCTLVEIQRHTDVFDTRKKDWAPRQETAYYVSTAPLSAAAAAQAARARWSIENRLHYVRDVTLGEDASRIRRNPGLFALLRSFALNLFRFNGVSNISLALYDNALNFDRLLAYQGL
jgi:predicted transposase YbfD/YdcC